VAENEASEHEAVFHPLVRAHEFNQGHWVLLHTVLLALLIID
jgi:hypothetical protein